jgi:DNA polymerase/3'-5' exonuclease PolX
MDLKTAEKIAGEIALGLVVTGACKKTQIAGSIRRKRPFVHDIEILDGGKKW